MTILTHYHRHHKEGGIASDYKINDMPSKLIIRYGAIIGTNAVIMESCNYIGINARIGAGAVITKNVPDNATVVGVPGKVIKINE